ncbi:MAG: molybdopterin converting factor subunit 1 [Gammaproteobacteria bacterium]|nr:MAG: molybdopterin converting factor subunit 1 [Gammaproteobacteria bacterium]
MAITVLFFARVREQLGCPQLLVESDGETIEALVNRWVAERGPSWQVLQQTDIRCALNQVMCARDTMVRDGDELAFFPPVTGG